jgi:hypothetical protein
VPQIIELNVAQIIELNVVQIIEPNVPQIIEPNMPQILAPFHSSAELFWNQKDLWIFVFFLLGGSPTSEFYVPTFRHTLLRLHRWSTVSEDGTVPKRRHIKVRRRGITQKKEYNIRNTTKVLNQEFMKTRFEHTQRV